MWPLNIIFPSGRTLQVMPRHLWLGAAVIASMAIFVAYVGLLNGTVERGAAQWRAVQEAGAPNAAKAVKTTLEAAPRRRSSVAG
jgi:hypothetical protein